MHFKLYASGKNASEELENVLQVVCIRFFRNLIEHFCCACEVRRGVVVRSEIVFSIIKRRGNACVILALRPSLLCVSYYCCMEQYTIHACKVHPPSFLKHCKLSRPIFTSREAELSWVYSVNFYFFGLVLTFVTSYWSLKP